MTDYTVVNFANVIPPVIPGEDLKTFGGLGSFEHYIEIQYRDTQQLLEKLERGRRECDPHLSQEYKEAMRPIMVITCWGEAQTASQIAQILTKCNIPKVQYYLCTHALDETRHTQIEWRRITDLGLATELNVPREQTDLFRFVNSLPSYIEALYGQVCMLEGYSANVLFRAIADLAEKNGDLATAATYEHVMHDETRHISTGIKLVKEEIARDPDLNTWRILELEPKILPILIRKLGRDSAIAKALYNAGLIEDRAAFEQRGFDLYMKIRQMVGLPEREMKLEDYV
ncbi:MAG: hypothetical protein D6723_05625 [Acidobacteria bacterium]|nr:MAG: hypothetical protein D6723_05625 [Acidobacteriota bacterium]